MKTFVQSFGPSTQMQPVEIPCKWAEMAATVVFEPDGLYIESN